MKLTLKLTILSILISYCADAQTIDIVGYDDVSVNGINTKSSVSDLLEVFGKPYSITEPNYDCGALSPFWNEVDVQLYSWEGIEFHLVDGVLEVCKIDFRKTNPIINTKQLTFDKNTQLNEFEEAFPKSFKTWEARKDKGGSTTIYLLTEENSDSQFHIIFENGRIIKFELFHPC